MAIRRFAHAAVVGCGLLLAACAATPVYPLMTPIQVAKTFGYFDQPIDETHAMVSYVTPQQSGYGFRYDQSPAEAQAKTLALDMALYHAAQVAQTRGYPAFSVTDRRTSVDSVNVSGYWDDPYWHGGWGFHHRHFWGGGAWGGPWGLGWYEPPENTLQVEAKLTIALTRTPKADDNRVDDTLNRLRAAYPNAEALPVPPPSTPAPPPKPTA